VFVFKQYSSINTPFFCLVMELSQNLRRARFSPLPVHLWSPLLRERGVCVYLLFLFLQYNKVVKDFRVGGGVGGRSGKKVYVTINLREGDVCVGGEGK